MYLDSLKEVKFLKLGGIAKAAGISVQKLNSLEVKEFGTKKDTYKELLKVLREVVRICKKVAKGEDKFSLYPDYFELKKLANEADVAGAFKVAAAAITLAYNDMLFRFKEIKEEEDFQDLEQEEKVTLFNEESSVVSKVVKSNIPAPVVVDKVATPLARAAFMKTEAGFVKRPSR